MLVSSVTLGLISDKYGRMCCIQVGFVISLLTTIGAILAQNYLLLNGLFMLMSLAQVGVANALSTLGECSNFSAIIELKIGILPANH